MELLFAKYQGAGNDFVLIDARTARPNLSREQIAFLCDRRFGIGADGLMTLETDPAGSDFYMRYYNSDGGESTMCGNGGRCIVLFAEHLGIGGQHKRFNAIDGEHEARLLPDGRIELQMIDVAGVEKLSPQDACGREGWFTDTGSPQYVEFTEDLDAVDLNTIAPQIRHNHRFGPQRGTNVNFVQILGPGHIRVRTFERGVEGETYACGTGSTGSAIVTHAVHQPEQKEFIVEVVGGELGVKFATSTAESFRNVLLTGPAKKVFDGKIVL